MVQSRILRFCFFPFCKMPAARTSAIPERKKNLILLMENENPCSIYETWRGNGCSLHDMEKCMGQRPKTLSLLSIMLHTERDTDMPEIVSIGYRCPWEEPVYSVQWPRQPQLLSKSWREGGEAGYMFRHIFTTILQTSLFPEEQDESSLLIESDLPIRTTIPHSLEHPFCQVYVLNGELRQSSSMSKTKNKVFFDSSKGLL